MGIKVGYPFCHLQVTQKTFSDFFSPGRKTADVHCEARTRDFQVMVLDSENTGKEISIKQHEGLKLVETTKNFFVKCKDWSAKREGESSDKLMWEKARDGW